MKSEWSGRRGVLGAVLSVGLFLAGTHPVVGQVRSGAERFGPPSRTTLTVFAAILSPVHGLTSDPNSFGTAISSAGGFGADAAFWFGNGHLGLDILGVFAPADLEVKPTDFQGAVPSKLGNADYVATTATLMYRFLPSGPAAAFHPYLGIGGGIRHLAVEKIAAPEVNDVTDPVVSVAAGTLLWFSRRFAIHLEVRDLISSFEAPTTGSSRLQNDILISVGLGTRLR